MVDNVSTPVSGSTIATDEIGGIHFQRVKITAGANGTATDLAAGAGVSGADVLRVTLASDDPAVAALTDTTPALVTGSTAADAALTSPPVTMGGRGSAAVPTAMSADGDVTNGWVDLYGRQIIAGSPRARMGRQTTTITSSTAETTIVTAGAASTFRDVYRLTMTNTSATATNVTVRDVTSTGAQDVYSLAAGETKGFSGPVDAADVQGTAASAWTAQCSVSVASVIICARYVERKA